MSRMTLVGRVLAFGVIFGGFAAIGLAQALHFSYTDGTDSGMGPADVAALSVPAFGAPTSRGVSLATAYQCTTTTMPCLFTVTLQSQSAISLGGASNNEGAVMLGPTNGVAGGTGTVLATYKNNLGGTLVIGLNITSQQANTYTVPVPTGHWIAVRQTAGTGLQVVSSFDQQIGS